MCEKHEGHTKGPSTWTTWRIKFKAISSATNLENHCRDLADKALQTMERIESAGVTTNVLEEYGMSFLDGDTVVSMRPEARNFIGKRDEWDEYGQNRLPDDND